MRDTNYAGSTWALASSQKLFQAILSPVNRDLFYRPELGEQGGADLPAIQA